MFELIIGVLIFALVLIAIFYIVCGLIMLFTGCSLEEAAKKIQKFFSDDSSKGIYNDSGFCQEVDGVIRKILGDKMYENMMKIAQTGITPPLLCFGEISRLPCIAISMYCDEQQKIILKNVLSSVVKKYMKIHKYGLDLIVNWKVREDLNMPYLEFIYARNQEEKHILDILLAEEREKIKAANSPVIDDTETEDLDD